ncbi:ABC transporter ATP-binding protein [Amylibacter sp.]|jgi:iron(III) transport system ATP-binding protein|nr:ABC transporter ATP-binding protein [Amylibacter sp.]HAB39174.1 polyamine ABC transporter ATP-binding protein [Paracoccaceae bacterium]MDA9582688.1 ABC transporter ATP-binding protein [Amylibacter sp.]MDB9715441.1 ABC transporter ATP-binding protein [Amylibacter sp.]MDC0983135.1 ABC transporter ATP-binding protein [Amylibacter sp.]|tara:strand:+ start:1293 stop:2345 length:1053 start_codon:yes stop_codon:yes gene_type:complete
MKKAGIKIENLHLSFGETEVLNGVSLEIKPGEFFAFLGPSGSGKSTLLRAIAGFGPKPKGRIMIGNKDILGLDPWKRNIGMVFQSYALWPHMTVRNNVGFGLRERKLPSKLIKTKVDAALDLVDLSHLADRMPNQLSGGQQQRIALARTIVVEPEVLLLDEPLSNLDASLRVQMRRELLRLQRQLGLTTIFVTHDQEEANTTSDRMAVLDGGVIQQIGSPQELYDKPSNLFVANFLGTANILEGKIEILGNNKRFLTKTGDSLSLSEGSSTVGNYIILRPQNISINHKKSKNSLPGKVRHSEFLGSQIRYIVTAGGTEIVIDQSHRAGQDWFANGTDVHLLVNTSTAVVI